MGKSEDDNDYFFLYNSQEIYDVVCQKWGESEHSKRMMVSGYNKPGVGGAYLIDRRQFGEEALAGVGR